MQSWAKRIVCAGMAMARAVLGRPAQASIQSAPAFTAKELSDLPTSDWITNGGTISNDRYWPLTLINRDKAAGLKAKWRNGMACDA